MLDGELLYTKILEVNLFAFAYRLFHEDFSPIDGELLERSRPPHSKMPTVRNARSLVTSRELPSGLQIWGKRPAECIVLSGYSER